MIIVYSYRKFATKDKEAVRRLVKATFPEFLNGDYWDWKYLSNPDFDPSLVVVAERGGEIVGCSHWLQRDFKISKNTAVRSILTCDLAVKPEHRSQGIARKLVLERRTLELFKKRGIIVNYDFSTPTLAKRLYQPVLGYVPVKSSTRTYFRLLSWRRMAENLEKVSAWEARVNFLGKLPSAPLSVLLKLRGAPPLKIEISQEGIKALDESSEADIVIESSLAIFSSLKSDGITGTKLVMALITRKIKVKGKLTSLFRLYQSLGAIKAILRGLDLRARPLRDRNRT